MVAESGYLELSGVAGVRLRSFRGYLYDRVERVVMEGGRTERTASPRPGLVCDVAKGEAKGAFGRFGEDMVSFGGGRNCVPNLSMVCGIYVVRSKWL